MRGPLRFFRQPDLKHPALIIGWGADASAIGAKVADYLNRKLGGQSFSEIEPFEFFPLGGVSIENDMVQFPESRFSFCHKKDLVVLESAPPSYEWYKFLSLVLDVAERCQVRELYTIGSMVSLSAHTTPRELLGIFNSPELKQELSRYHLSGGWDYETPPGQRPTLSSFLLWAAKKRSIPAASLWVSVPFYLISFDDRQAAKRILDFFNGRLSLEIDLSDLDEEAMRQNRKLAQARESSADINEYITKLESSLRLSEEESQNLVAEITAVQDN